MEEGTGPLKKPVSWAKVRKQGRAGIAADEKADEAGTRALACFAQWATEERPCPPGLVREMATERKKPTAVARRERKLNGPQDFFAGHWILEQLLDGAGSRWRACAAWIPVL